MNCMKCGKPSDDTQVFCSDCLAVMGRYPVNTSTPVTLPNRASSEAGKKGGKRKRELSAEEQLQRLARSNRRLRFLVLILMVVCIVTAVFLFHQLNQPGETMIGRNYTVGPS